MGLKFKAQEANVVIQPAAKDLSHRWELRGICCKSQSLMVGDLDFQCLWTEGDSVPPFHVEGESWGEERQGMKIHLSWPFLSYLVIRYPDLCDLIH